MRLAGAGGICERQWCRRQRLGESPPAGGESIRIWYNPQMHLDAAHPLLPIVTLVAGVFLMIAPRIVSFAVAVYLITVGLLGTGSITSSISAESAGPKPRAWFLVQVLPTIHHTGGFRGNRFSVPAKTT